jgi:hypothetical protein
MTPEHESKPEPQASTIPPATFPAGPYTADLWIYSRGTRDERRVPVILTPNFRICAMDCDEGKGGNPFTFPLPVAMATATLFAASQDLLEAASGIVREMHRLKRQGVVKMLDTDFYDLECAVAKATGTEVQG